jgi:hypothetical protein
MTGMVDSREKQLNPLEIVTIAIENMGNKYPLQVTLSAIATEMNQPNSEEKLIGNTLFSVLTGKDGKGFFKAYNADIPANYVKNSKEFCVWAKEELGLRVLVTQFHDRAISTLFHVIARNPPMEGMGFKEYKTTDGGSRIVLNLGA